MKSWKSAFLVGCAWRQILKVNVWVSSGHTCELGSVGAQTAESAASHPRVGGTEPQELVLLGTPWVNHWHARVFWFPAYSHYFNNWIRIPLFSQAGGTQHPGKQSVWFSWTSLWHLWINQCNIPQFAKAWAKQGACKRERRSSPCPLSWWILVMLKERYLGIVNACAVQVTVIFPFPYGRWYHNPLLLLSFCNFQSMQMFQKRQTQGTKEILYLSALSDCPKPRSCLK